MATSRLSSAVAVTVAVLLLLLVIAAATTLMNPKRTPVGEEGFEASNELTPVGQGFNDATRCIVGTSDGRPFTFASEALAAHPGSTQDDPKCVVVRSGMGLLKSDDTVKCEVLPNHELYNWTNPMQQNTIKPELVSSIPRCVMSVEKTTETSLYALDKKLMEEGASIRSGYPELKYNYDLLEEQLGRNTDELKRSTDKLKDTSSLLNNTMDAVRLKKEQRNNTANQLVALASEDATTMNGINELYAAVIKKSVDNIDSAWTQRLSVTVYTAIQFGGAGVVKNPGFYDVDKIGLPDKTISSIKVEPGMWIQVFHNSARGGEWKVFREDQLDLTQVSMSSQGGNWNDQISSILVGAGPTPEESMPKPMVAIKAVAKQARYVRLVQAVSDDSRCMNIQEVKVFDASGVNVSSGKSVTMSSQAPQMYARYVTLAQDTQKDYMNIGEVMVYDDKGVNVAAGKPVTMSTEANNVSMLKKHLTDGDINTMAHTNIMEHGWITIDLGSLFAITKITVVNRKDSQQDRLIGTVIKLLDAAKQLVFTSRPLSAAMQQHVNISRSARNLTDDDLNTIAHTNCSERGWMMIDLGSVMAIGNVQVINRKDCCQDRLVGTVVELLDTNKNVVYTSSPLSSADVQNVELSSADVQNVEMSDVPPPVPQPSGGPQWVHNKTLNDLSSVSMSGSDRMCGLKKDDTIYCSTNAGKDWAKKTGLLRQISIDGVKACGVTKDNDAFCVDNIDELGRSQEWRHIKNAKLKNISVTGSKMCGITPSDDILCAPFGVADTWKQKAGKLKQIAVKGNMACGVNSGSDIFCTENVDSEAYDWNLLPGKLTQVALGTWGAVCGVDSGSEIYCTQDRSGKTDVWVKSDGLLQQVELDIGMACGVNAGGDLVCKKGIKLAPST
jgi:hypothetical protein